MAKKKGQRNKKNGLVAQKNKVRGVIASSKNRTYQPDSTNRAAVFQRQLADVLVKAREKLGGATAPAFIEWVEAQTAAQLPDLKSAPIDSELSGVAADRPAKPLAEEILWVASRLAPHAQQLSDFRRLAHLLEEHALVGRLADATSVLDEIESRHGRSIWWVEARVGFTQSRAGLDAQKQVVAEIRKSNPNSLAAYVGRFASIRNEPSTTLNSFFADTAERINRIKQQSSLRTYLRFRLLWNSSFTQKDLASVLVVSQGLSVVDLYETFIEVVQLAYVSSCTPDIRRAIETALSTMNVVQDFRLSKLALLLHRAPDQPVSHRPYDSSSALLRGEFKVGLKRAVLELQRDPRAFRTALLAASVYRPKKQQGSKAPQHWSNLIRRIGSMLTFDEDYPSSWLDLEKTLRNWTFSSTLRACYYALKSHLTDDAATRAQSRKLTALNSAHIDIDEFALYSDAFAKDALRHAPKTESVSTLHTAFLLTNGPTAAAGNIAKPFEIFLRTQASSDILLIDDLERLDRLAAETPSRALRVYVRRAYLGALVEAARIAELVSVATDTYFSLCVPAPLLPLKREFTTLRWKQLRPLAKEITLSIVLHLSWRGTGNDLVASNLRYAYSDLLALHGVSNPVQLVSLETDWRKEQLIYFLRFVCVPDILDMSSQIRSSRAAQEARREVCAALSQLDPDNREAYDNETFTITRTLSVQDGMRVLDSSRVHVDTSAITSWAVREWEPNIARYRALVDAGIGVSDSLDDVWRELSGKHGTSKKFLEIPDSDADLILADMISGLRNKFLLDPSHGLDSYLSRRVRHHSMSGYLRGAVEHANLITTKDHRTGRYLANTYWPDRIEAATTSENQELQRALSKFCDEFDRIVLNLKTDTFRINSDTHPRGLFSITVSPPMFHLIRSAIQPNFSIETFCEVCYSIFWTSLKPALEAAQLILKNDTYNAISSAFHRLKASLRRIYSDPQRYAALSVAIQSTSDDLNRKIASIADWFNRNEAVQSHQTYSLEQALEICIQAALHSLKPFTPRIQSTVEPGKTASSILLVQMAEIVLTMLGNVRQHADSGHEPNVEISVTTDGNSVQVRMESDIGHSASTGEARRRVDGIRAQIVDGSYIDRISVEGLSGLTKMACVALATPQGKMEFDFVGDNRFFVLVKWHVPSHVEFVVSEPGTRAA